MEADYERQFRGRRFKLFLKRRPNCCPPLPPESRASVLFRTILVPSAISLAGTKTRLCVRPTPYCPSALVWTRAWLRHRMEG